ncbi:YceI family protein [Flammeovirga yaeyamensis]|uniref:YceI family protein n=1 Tax=Flammeovirga yaeyamensis TaxID=367791 RepID=A0AAX1N6H0_9BACT|nr:YceI family protein [Flammeovirga yaeyamensis]MBB3697395.1 polyisoprenoid-binding protein YceI [Flammeovirga yaeyamensis]NMF36089.1 YceI family protein [Flammeovirga yaeyamensis]QWG02822.1 YceI family protein [Flammeovirga yaeyamensis]
MKGLSTIITLNFVLFISLFANAQDQKKLSNDSKITIEGTSSLHDWHSDVKQVSGSAQLATDGNKVTSIDQLDLTFVVKSIESGKSAMNKNIFKALKEDKNPNITFKSTSATVDANGVVTAKGNLTIAGATKEVTLTANSAVNGSKVTFEGKTTFNMTEYSVEPPTAMFGTITTGDEVTIVYSAVFGG